MTPAPRPPVFVPRAAYRQRRLRDLARLLPLVGAVLFLIPLLWPQRGDGLSGEVQMTSGAIVYIFATWAALVVVSALISRLLRPDDPATDPLAEPAGRP